MSMSNPNWNGGEYHNLHIKRATFNGGVGYGSENKIINQVSVSGDYRQGNGKLKPVDMKFDMSSKVESIDSLIEHLTKLSENIKGR